MFVELHLLQNFAPSNLNRDDTGAPKDCEFGGYRRARISSQCLKRAIRRAFEDHDLIAPEHRAKPTSLVVREVGRLLSEKGHPFDQAGQVVETLLKGVQLSVNNGETQYLLFLGNQELAALADVCSAHWDSLVAAAENPASPGGEPKSARSTKKQAKASVPIEARQALERILDGGRAADLALFGRMLADQSSLNVDAACQVAHAISTNRVNMEFDFFTAVDDLKPREEDPGAGMLGTVEFNSACYYRYANIDVEQLKRNLQGDEDLARATVRAFIEASIAAIPTGKQNSMAAQNPPSFVMAVLRERGLWSLANAFLKPVEPRGDQDLMHASILALDRYWGKLTRMYGNHGIYGPWVALLDDEVSLSSLTGAVQTTVAELVNQVTASVRFNGAAGQAG